MSALASVIDAVRRGGEHHSDPLEDRWHAVTINCPPERLETLPQPLAALGDAIEVQIRPAPGDKGTEVLARLREATDETGDDDPRGKLRRALRESRSLVEIGEVIEPNRNRTTEPTVLNRPVAAATKRGREGGVL
jgi:hypothetical protein